MDLVTTVLILVVAVVVATEQPLQAEDGEVAVVPTSLDQVVLVVQEHGDILEIKHQ